MCTECNKRFSDPSNLHKHQRTHTGVQPYSCTQCGKQFSQIATRDRHMMNHTGLKPYTCSHCNKQFTQKGSLKRHQMIHTGQKPHVCTVCNKGFIQSVQLKSHMKTHTCKWLMYITCDYQHWLNKYIVDMIQLEFYYNTQRWNCLGAHTLKIHTLFPVNLYFILLRKKFKQKKNENIC